jgi:predicted kinase
MKKLILVCGPAGIGKSTFCQLYIAQHPKEKVTIISSDEIRKRMTGGYDKFLPNKDMSPVYGAMCQEATALYNAPEEMTVMLDTTMLNDERRLFFINRIPRFEEEDLYLLKLHDYGVCYLRNKERVKEKWVPESVIDDMIKCYQDPSPEIAKRFDHVETFYIDHQK